MQRSTLSLNKKVQQQQQQQQQRVLISKFRPYNIIINNNIQIIARSMKMCPLKFNFENAVIESRPFGGTG